MTEAAQPAPARMLTRQEIYSTWNGSPPGEWSGRVEAIIRKFCQVNGGLSGRRSDHGQGAPA